MITIMKKYMNPMLQIVSIKRTDIITGSDPMAVKGNYGDGTGITLGAADRFRDFEDYSN